MKALLLKDFYMMLRYCRMFFVIILVLLYASYFIPGSEITAYFPVVIAGIIPVTLVSYDEREKWHIYSATLPFSRAQIVSSKYLLGAITTLVTFLLSITVMNVRFTGGILFLFFPYYFLPGYITLASSLIGTAIILTLIFRFGAEKGRIAFYIVIGMIFLVSLFAQNIGLSWPGNLDPKILISASIFGSLLLFGGAWLLSIRFYQKRAL
jgi:ABC-2 type transport system permease protein